MGGTIAKRPQALGLLFTAITMFAVLAFGLCRPANNWDLIGYVAAASSADGHRGADLSRVTFDSLGAAVDPATFQLMTQQDDYRRTVFSDPVSLSQQLPFYRIRVAYVRTLRAIHAATGMGYPKATHVVSAAFAALSVLLLAALCREVGVPLAAVPVIAVPAGMLDIASLSSPDAMACAFALLALLALLRRSGWLVVVAAVLPLVRTDFVLLSALLCAHAFIDTSRVRATVAMAVAVAAYLAASRGAYGWLTLFNMSFIHKSPYPATLAPSHAFGDYLRPYVTVAMGLAMHPQGAIYGLGIFVAGFGRQPAEALADRTRFIGLLVLPAVFVGIHLVLFPAASFRFFVFAASAIMVWLMARLSAPAGR